MSIKANGPRGDWRPIHLRAASIRAVPPSPQPRTSCPFFPGPFPPPLLSAGFPPECVQPLQQTLLCAGTVLRAGLHSIVPAFPQLPFVAFTFSVSSCESATHKLWPPAGSRLQGSSLAHPSGWPIITQVCHDSPNLT